MPGRALSPVRTYIYNHTCATPSHTHTHTHTRAHTRRGLRHCNGTQQKARSVADPSRPPARPPVTRARPAGRPPSPADHLPQGTLWLGYAPLVDYLLAGPGVWKGARGGRHDPGGKGTWGSRRVPDPASHTEALLRSMPLFSLPQR